MADTIVIKKSIEGVILVTNNGDEYTLLPSYRLQKKDGKVEVRSDLGGLIDTFDPAEVEKVILTDGSEVAIPDLDTLYTQLTTNFFFLKPGIVGLGKDLEFISDANTKAGQDGNYRFKMVAGKLQTQKLIASVWTALEEV